MMDKNKKSKALKSFSVAILAGLTTFGAQVYGAETVNPENPAIEENTLTIDDIMRDKGLDAPTLDALNDAGILMPDGVDEEGNYTYNNPDLVVPQSGYKFVNTDENNISSNTIKSYILQDVTKYYDPETGEEVLESQLKDGVDYYTVTTKEAVAQYKNVELRNTIYDITKVAEGETAPKTGTLNFEWTNSKYTQGTFLTPSANKSDLSVTFQTQYGEGNGVKHFEFADTDPDNVYSSNHLTWKEVLNPTGKNAVITVNFQDEYGDVKNSSNATKDEYTWTAWENDKYSGTKLEKGSSNNSIKYYENTKYTKNEARMDSFTTGKDIEGRFKGQSNSAIHNTDSEIGDIIGEFINNNWNGGSSGGGGAIFNQNGTIKDINANFVGNHSNNIGGAIFNASSTSSIGNIYGSFIANSSDNPGGAIFNNGVIKNITADFIGNTSLTYNSNNNNGGAIYNNSGAEIGVIKGNFIGNTAYSKGGAIYNAGHIKGIEANFIGNNAPYGSGGAIANVGGRIDYIKGDFIGNNANGGGGSIYIEGGKIGKIEGNFVGNTAMNGYGASSIFMKGGEIEAINANFIGNSGYYAPGLYLEGGKIGNINANFIGNIAKGDGGALRLGYNSEVGNITGNFIGNITEGSGDGGAILNNGKIGHIVANFICNSEKASDGGGAIMNYGSGRIESITGDFIGNVANGFGGAISNMGSMGDIVGDFIGNRSTYGSGGGAISNSSRMGNITGNFINNHSTAYGGAIYNWGSTIGNITGNFIGNSGGDGGGALRGKFANITGDFIGNYIDTNDYFSSYPSPEGGAIKIDSYAGNIKGNFIGNYIKNTTTTNSARGGAIYYSGSAASVVGDFIGNYIYNEISDGYGGALYTVGTMDGNNFIGNYIETFNGGSYGGAICYSYSSNPLSNLNFIQNYAKTASGIAQGGAIYYPYSSVISNSNFISNHVESNDGLAQGGATYNAQTFVNSNFIGNYAKTKSGKAQGGAIFYNYADINIIAENGSSTFSENYVQVGDNEKESQAIFLGNNISYNSYSRSTSGTDRKTLYKDTVNNPYDVTLSLIANDNGTIIMNDKIAVAGEEEVITDSYYTKKLEDGSYVKQYVDDNDQDITDKSLLTKVKTSRNYNIKLTGTESGKIYLNNNIEGSPNVSLADTNLYLGKRDNVLDGTRLSLNSGFMSMINNQVGVSKLQTLTVNGDTNFVADVDLGRKQMDRFVVTGNEVTGDLGGSYGEHQGNLNVIGMNLLTDASSKVTAVYFAEPGLMNNVTYDNNTELPGVYQGTAYTPIFKYNFFYDKENQYDGKGKGGYFVFTRGDVTVKPKPVEFPTNDYQEPTVDEPSTDEPPVDQPPAEEPLPDSPMIEEGIFQTGYEYGSTGNKSDAFNPAVLAAPVNTQVAGHATVTETFRYVFEHADGFTQLPADIRMSKINANKYALSTDFNYNIGSFNKDLDTTRGIWVRPYTTFEKIDLKNGPDINVTTYGTLVGYDSNFRELKRGWHNVGTLYLGYLGSQSSYSGVKSSMNGGLLGITETFYKGNFWTALTASAGAGVSETHTMYGKEDAAMLMAGVSNKTGYNVEFKNGKYIVQPIVQLNYTFVNTFNYKNAAGVEIDTPPMNSLQLNPSMRFITNLKHGWQPYAKVGMVWNLMNKTKGTANGYALPSMQTRPYVEYGVGLQRNWNDKFTAFGQAMIRNGGRTGIAFTAGFRWSLGKDAEIIPLHHKHQKVENTTPSYRKIIKQNDISTKNALKNQKNSTITVNNAVFRQL